jgi:nucleoside-diphosphate-sugar epimerase
MIAPYMAAVTSVRAPASNAAARRDLGWRPRYPTHRDGLSEMLSHAA